MTQASGFHLFPSIEANGCLASMGWQMHYDFEERPSVPYYWALKGPPSHTTARWTLIKQPLVPEMGHTDGYFEPQEEKLGTMSQHSHTLGEAALLPIHRNCEIMHGNSRKRDVLIPPLPYFTWKQNSKACYPRSHLHFLFTLHLLPKSHTQGYLHSQISTLTHTHTTEATAFLRNRVAHRLPIETWHLSSGPDSQRENP